MSQRESTQQAWLARFSRVADHVVENLDEDLNLDSLSQVACLSPYHLQRCWRAFTGETLAQMVTRLRLHRASGELLHSEDPVEAVAQRAGYGSAAAFTRAFARHYGSPPATYRAAGRSQPPLAFAPQMEGNDPVFEVRIEDAEAFTLAAIRHTGNYMEVEKPFNQVFAWAMGAGKMTPETLVAGLYHDDPGSVPEADLRADVGLSVAPGTAVEDPIRLIEIPGGAQAILHYKGPYAELMGAYNWLFGTWLPQSGREPGDSPCYEVYLTDPREVPASENITEIHLPLKA